MEKALLDYFYLNPSIRDEEDFESLRINEEALLERLDRDRLEEYSSLFNQGELNRRMKRFMRRFENA